MQHLILKKEYDKAERLHWEALTGLETTLGSEHPLTLAKNFGILSHQRRYKDAAFLYRRAEGHEKIFGKQHLMTQCDMTEKFKSIMRVCWGEVRFIGEAIHGCIDELLGLLPPFSIIVVFLVLFVSRLVVVGARKDF